MAKKLNAQRVLSELSEGSAFFPGYKKREVVDSPTPTSLPAQTIHSTISSPLQAKSAKRKQVSAYLTPDQLQKLKTLHFTLNNSPVIESEIEKSDIVALGIECLSTLLGTQVPEYSNTQDFRTAILDSLSKYLRTQVPET